MPSSIVSHVQYIYGRHTESIHVKLKRASFHINWSSVVKTTTLRITRVPDHWPFQAGPECAGQFHPAKDALSWTVQQTGSVKYLQRGCCSHYQWFNKLTGLKIKKNQFAFSWQNSQIFHTLLLLTCCTIWLKYILDKSLIEQELKQGIFLILSNMQPFQWGQLIRSVLENTNFIFCSSVKSLKNYVLQETCMGSWQASIPCAQPQEFLDELKIKPL